MEHKTQIKRHQRIWIPFFMILCPWIFLVMWIPPFGLICGVPLMWLDSLTGMSAADQFIYMTSDILDHGISILYLLLAAGVILNLINAILFSMKEQYENAQGVMLLLRITSVITYIALLWGLPFAVFFLIGPDQNKHIFFLIALSFPALNLSGAFYAVSLTLDLRKKRRISSPTAVFYLIASFILGLDIITAFLIRRNRKVRLS